MKELQITIAGQAATGKSTIMVLLEQFLVERGFDVGVELDNEVIDYGSVSKFRRIINENFGEREQAIRKNTKITLKQVQVKSGS